MQPFNELWWPKRCSHCHQLKRSTDFHADATRPDGLSYTCKECKNAAGRERYRRRLEYYRAYKRNEWRWNGRRRRAELKGKRAFYAAFEVWLDEREAKLHARVDGG